MSVGALVAAMLAFALSAAAGPAMAATQHWATTAHLPSGSPQSFTAKADSPILLDWELGGARVSMECETVTSTGSVENQSGGSAGTMNTESLSLGECYIAAKYCTLKNRSIPFGYVKSELYEKSGEDRIRYLVYGTSTVVIESSGGKCNLAGKEYLLQGTFILGESSNGEGVYQVNSSESSLTLMGDELAVVGNFGFVTPTKESLVLSSVNSPGAPEWYYDNLGWSDLAAGESATVSSSEMSLKVVSEPLGTKAEISCEGPNDRFTGSLENPVGGSAAKGNAIITLDECKVLNAGKERICNVQPVVSHELSGVAIEGEGGSQEIKFSPVSGSVIITFVVENGGGAKKCGLRASDPIEGKLVTVSDGKGSFELFGGELMTGLFPASLTGAMRLEAEGGEFLRLQA
ncbi:MAG TPA: hypothetical protein VMH33_08515 [Solirubrobacterales bacterium]|nr:hypothetical protein [Solirubrobacterales bacterium]